MNFQNVNRGYLILTQRSKYILVKNIQCHILETTTMFALTYEYNFVAKQAKNSQLRTKVRIQTQGKIHTQEQNCHTMFFIQMVEN